MIVVFITLMLKPVNAVELLFTLLALLVDLQHLYFPLQYYIIISLKLSSKCREGKCDTFATEVVVEYIV